MPWVSSRTRSWLHRCRQFNAHEKENAGKSETKHPERRAVSWWPDRHPEAGLPETLTRGDVIIDGILGYRVRGRPTGLRHNGSLLPIDTPPQKWHSMSPPA